MKFEIGQKVKIRVSGVTATVISYKYETTYNSGKIIESRRYYIKNQHGNVLWLNEYELQDDQYEFDSKFEIELLDMLIDIYLSNGKYDLVKVLDEERRKLRGVK